MHSELVVHPEGHNGKNLVVILLLCRGFTKQFLALLTSKTRHLITPVWTFASFIKQTITRFQNDFHQEQERFSPGTRTVVFFLVLVGS